MNDVDHARRRPARLLALLAAAVAAAGCQRGQSPPAAPPAGATTRPAAAQPPAPAPAEPPPAETPRAWRVAHVFVCLCDNDNQGIAKVPAALGNGRDPAGNLYWGAMYGLKTFLRRSGDWQTVEIVRADAVPAVLDRACFRADAAGPAPLYVLAEAYDGVAMRQALTDFLTAAAGALNRAADLRHGQATRRLDVGGRADVVCFVGHNGLMEIQLPDPPRRRGPAGPQAAVVLACRSRPYFAEPLARAGCEPLITTAGLMAPEAYTLDAVLRAWAAGASPQEVHEQAAAAYARYQKCSLPAARRLFVAGP